MIIIIIVHSYQSSVVFLTSLYITIALKIIIIIIMIFKKWFS